MNKLRSGFTMLELVFVIAIIGILSAIALPKFAVTRDSALISRGKSTLASVRSAISTERQKRILRGNFTPISALSSAGTKVFDQFDNGNELLQYPLDSCTESGCWEKVTPKKYRFHYIGGQTCIYQLNTAGTKFEVDGSGCSVFGE